MLIELKPQLRPLDMTGLQRFVREQEARLAKLNNIIAGANKRIDALKKAAAPPPPGISGAERQVLKTVTDRQLYSMIGAIRRESDDTIIPIIKDMRAAADSAKEMGERHWDFFSVLRNAKTGSGDVQGFVEAMQLRAAYAEILAVAGTIELARFAQQAIDTGDPILADAVLRENGARKQTDQPFMNAALLQNLPNTDHHNAQVYLNQVIDLNQQAGLAYSEFQRQSPDAFKRIAIGLKARQNINDLISEDGAIIPQDAQA